MNCPIERGGCGARLQPDEGAFCKNCMGREANCPKCNGMGGTYYDNYRGCEFCFGTGKVNAVPASLPGPSVAQREACVLAPSELLARKGQYFDEQGNYYKFREEFASQPKDVEEAWWKLNTEITALYDVRSLLGQRSKDEVKEDYEIGRAALAVIKAALSKQVPQYQVLSAGDVVCGICGAAIQGLALGRYFRDGGR